MEAKKPWQSKTLWLNLIMAISALAAPGVEEYIKSHPDVVAVGWSIVNMVLRVVSKEAIQIKES